MIDSVIEKVESVGDEAAQAKAMISEFIKMNVVMTVLLSIPFVLVLWLSQAGYIQVINQSEIDQKLWQLCLWVLRSQDELKQTQYAPIQIMLSNMFFMIFATVFISLSTFKKIKQMFFVLFHRESYKFLQKKPSTTANLIDFMGLIFFAGYIIVIAIQINPIPSFYYGAVFCIYMSFLVFFQISNMISTSVVRKIRKNNI